MVSGRKETSEIHTIEFGMKQSLFMCFCQIGFEHAVQCLQGFGQHFPDSLAIRGFAQRSAKDRTPQSFIRIPQVDFNDLA